VLERLAAAHLAELKKAAPAFDILMRQLQPVADDPVAAAVGKREQC
jgi:hypothetical protein